VNYGLRYDTTFGLFTASGRSQLDNPALLTLEALQIPLFQHPGAPHDYRKQFGPRLGIAYAPGQSRNTVIRAGLRPLLQRSGAKRLGDGVSGRE
jgi:hypothetical protein